MKNLRIISYLFIIYETFFNLVIGQATNNNEDDCDKLYKFLNGSSGEYLYTCCDDTNLQIKCDFEGSITYFSR